MGRPKGDTYTPKMGAIICGRLSDGESLRSVCRDKSMPAASTVWKWLADHKEFSEQYARACVERADAIFEDSIEIADDGRNDWMARQSEAEKGAGWTGGWVLNGEHVQRSKLRVDTRKWFVSKLNPKKYGEKMQQEHTGSMTIKWED